MPPGAGAGTPPPADPRDSSYWSTLGQLDFRANEGRRRIGEQSAFEAASMKEALRRLHDAQPQVEQRATNQANARGLLYSGALGQQIGDMRTDVLRRQTDAQNAFAQRESQRRGQLGAIDAGLVADRGSAFSDAIDRAAQNDLNAPLVAPPAPPVPALTARRRARPPAPRPRRPFNGGAQPRGGPRRPGAGRPPARKGHR